MKFKFTDDKLKHEMKNSLNKLWAADKVKDIESITYEGSNILRVIQLSLILALGLKVIGKKRKQ